jgi:hypothetical protein
MTDGGNWKEMLRASSLKGGGDAALVHYHLDHGVDPNYQHPEYMTAPLHEAIRAGNHEIVSLLLQGGANPTLREDITGNTPLEVALESKQHAIVDILLQVLPEDYECECQTILVTGTYNRDLLAHLLTLGHRIVVGVSSPEEETVVATALKALPLETGNHKLVIKQLSELQDYFRDSKLMVHEWVHKITDSDSLLSNVFSNYQACSLKEYHDAHSLKILLVLESTQLSRTAKEQLSWLLAFCALAGNEHVHMTAMLEPASWWDKMTYHSWYPIWCENIARLLALDERPISSHSYYADLQRLYGKLYTYDRHCVLLPAPDTAGSTTGTWKQQFQSILA